jgi:uncharacterized membrane protein YkoI
MRKLIPLIALAVLWPAGPALAGPGSEQGEARREVRAGKIRKSDEIEQFVIPQMRGWQYLGFEYDPAALAYRLKFIRDGRVVFVDVDARSGEILRQRR